MSKAILVQGLAFGDEGKGATVDFLCRRLPVDLVVRYNGGSQAAHNVVTPEGVHHCFSQFGAGMLADAKVRTHLSRFMLVDPLTMMNEAEHLILARDHAGLCSSLTEGEKLLWGSVTVDPRCVIITPFHKRLNRLREQARGDARHGSCGMGVGVAREWQLKYGDAVLYAEDLIDRTTTLQKLYWLNSLAVKEVGWFRMGDDDIGELVNQYAHWPARIEAMPQTECVVFEGAQGVLLDETHGIAPHNTWTDCTFNNAETLCAEAGITDKKRIGCLRSYFTRHGAGPFPTESGMLRVPEEKHNGTGEWQGAFRTGYFDWGLTRQSLNIVGGVDGLAVSHLDRFSAGVDGFHAYQMLESIEELAPIFIVANGPAAVHRAFTKEWSL